MSVAAMTMDDQRPLMNNYDKMPKQYEQSSHGTGGSGAPPSGPASPTPSSSEEPSSQHPYHHPHHHHMHHHHHHHPQHTHHQQYHHQHQLGEQQLQPPSPTMLPSLPQQQQHQQLSLHQQQQHQNMPTVAEAVAVAEPRQRLLEEEIESLKIEQTRLSQQCVDSQRREKILMRRLANKEQEFQDYVSQITEYKASQAPSALALRSALLDPAVNLLFEKLKKELKATKAKLEETQNELSAWKFTPDSNTGKRLMAKCRLLYQENEELGKMTSNGRLAKLETELAMQKSFSEEVKKSQSELDDFLQELDEDVEGMQSTILFLQQELKTTRDRIQVLEKENFQLKNGSNENEIVKVAEADGDVGQTADATIQHVEANGNITDVDLAPYNTLLQISATDVIDIKHEASPLESIIENEYLHTLPPLASEYCNGNEEQAQPQIITNSSMLTAVLDEGSSGSNGSVAGKFRTSRKRAYEVGANESPMLAATIATPPPPVSLPRTLPPKKLKFRVTPVRRASLNSPDTINAQPPMQHMGMGVNLPEPEHPLTVVENIAAAITATTGVANEEASVALVTDVALESPGGVAQRIMTRRRSLRMQQNGSSIGSGGDGNL